MFAKLLKFIALLLGAAVVLVAALLCYLKFALPKVTAAPTLTIDSSPARIARGRYLAEHVAVCIDCHSTRDWSRFSGPPVPGTTGRGGEIFDQRLGFPPPSPPKTSRPPAWARGPTANSTAPSPPA